ncbi:hypothetical protein GCM10027290_32860 [Micromonospora sonneratiae]|uniref:PASTA domain-containing protein n=1 Tax=Micromonospora sonneratiae TaxID=1184706 RepID=A0ABW3YDN5_9ACTN
MTDGSGNWNRSSGGNAAESSRLMLVSGSALALVVFATVGAVGGWLLARSENESRSPSAYGSQSPSAAPAPTRTSATTRQPNRPPTTPPSTAAGGVLLPNLVGMDFRQAREEVRKRGLGAQLYFDGVGDNLGVSRTVPPADTPVRPGHTVKIYVIGSAPEIPVPNLVGLDCEDAKSRLVDAGFYPDYPTGKIGQVTRQDPEPSETKRWNDKVKIYCGSQPSYGPGSPAA